jgi:HTH-type transcriptional regulator/antitoxin HigA
MAEHQLKAKELADLLGVGKSFISEILSYKKGFSKENIWKLAHHFKVKQELFNRPYKLISPANSHLRNASVMNTLKPLRTA